MSVIEQLRDDFVFEVDYRKGGKIDSIGDITPSLGGTNVWKNTSHGKSVSGQYGAANYLSYSGASTSITDGTLFLMFARNSFPASGYTEVIYQEAERFNLYLLNGTNNVGIYSYGGTPGYQNSLLTITDLDVHVIAICFRSGVLNETRMFLDGVEGVAKTWTKSSGGSNILRLGGGADATYSGGVDKLWCAISSDALISGEDIAKVSQELLDSAHTGTKGKRNFSGNNMLDDGNMEESGVTSWTAGSAAVLTKQTTNPKTGSQLLRVAYGGTANPFFWQANNNKIGLQYRITGWARGNGTNTPRIISSGGQTIWNTFTSSTDWQYFDKTYTADGTYIKFYCLAGAAGYTEWDDIVIVPVGEPILDAGRIRPTYRNTFEDAVVSLGSSSGELNDFNIATGTWKISEDGTDKWLENVTAGVVFIPSDLAYGTWQFDLYKKAASSPNIIFIASAPQAHNDSAQNGYYFRFDSSEVMWLGETIAGSLSAKFGTVVSYADVDIKYSIRVTRSKAGVFTVYVKGGAFTSWTLIDPTGGTGTNPVTDSTTITSKFFTADLDVGDKITNIKMWKGVLDPTTYPNL